MYAKLFSLFILLACSFSLLANDDYDRGQELYKQKKYDEAFTYFEKAAEQGYAASQSYLGYMYEVGRGVTQDYKAAFNWYKKSAEQGSAYAQNNLGLMYENGRGVTQDYKAAASWHTKAAEQGFAKAQYDLGVIYGKGQGVNQDYNKAAIWWKKSAGQGYPKAQYNLGNMYVVGRGVTQDYKVALSWYTKAAEQGYAEAQSSLGLMYENGIVVTQDYKVALSWYTRAAEQGYAEAQSSLGLMYENGRGVTKDYNAAANWYKKAVEQGDVDASKNIALLKEKLACLSQAKVKLFDVALKCADRDELMAAVKNAGATVKNENKKNWGDIYNSQNILKGSSQLVVLYTKERQFATARYTFPSRMDTQKVLEVRNFVSNKYGEPDYSNGRVSLGEVTYTWLLEDGIELEVSRGWPDTTTYLAFVYPDNYKAMKDEQEKQKKARKAKEYEAQSNAF